MAKYKKPTLETKFHVDFAWWQEKGQNLKAYLQGHLCSECKPYLQDDQDETFDWIDPETGEVFQIDSLWHLIHAHCGQDPTFLDSRVPLTSGIFRTFILSDNTPMTPEEIHKVLQKQTPAVILRTIGGHQVYKGIKPLTVG
jgi:hypothetical protein